MTVVHTPADPGGTVSPSSLAGSPTSQYQGITIKYHRRRIVLGRLPVETREYNFQTIGALIPQSWAFHSQKRKQQRPERPGGHYQSHLYGWSHFGISDVAVGIASRLSSEPARLKRSSFCGPFASAVRAVGPRQDSLDPHLDRNEHPPALLEALFFARIWGRVLPKSSRVPRRLLCCKTLSLETLKLSNIYTEQALVTRTIRMYLKLSNWSAYRRFTETARSAAITVEDFKIVELGCSR
jgi:hypothetical protein